MEKKKKKFALPNLPPKNQTRSIEMANACYPRRTVGESARKSNYARDVSDRTENRSRSVEYNTGLVEVIRRSRGFDEDPNLFNSASVHASPVKVAG